MKEEFRKYVQIWLITGAVLVIAMVAIGGITRLTDSGLSMTDWKPLTGILPPMNEVEWQAEFDNYKQYPEFQKINLNFTLEDFKSIFWWEYIHRVFGRFIGMVFIIPFVFFLYKKVFDKTWVKKLIILLILGGFQGFLGWFMVKSGLQDQPDVSHYRLAIHLTSAFTVFSYVLWLFLESRVQSSSTCEKTKSITYWTYALTGFIILQIVYGAFVAGLKAGLYFNTWPKMDSYWVSPIVIQALSERGLIAVVEEPVVIQFIHRMIPYLILISIVVLWRKTTGLLNHRVKVVGAVWFLQFLLGILTLVLKVPLWLGVVHQLGAVVLLSALVWFLFGVRRGR